MHTQRYFTGLQASRSLRERPGSTWTPEHRMAAPSRALQFFHTWKVCVFMVVGGLPKADLAIFSCHILEKQT